MLVEINLLPPYKREQSLPFILWILCSVIGFILLILVAIFSFQLNEKLKAAESIEQQLIAEKEILEQEIITLESNQKDTLEEAVLFARQYVLPTTPLLEEFIFQLPEDSFLKAYDYYYDGVRIRVEHDNMPSVASFISNLVASDFFKDVKLNNVVANEVSELHLTYDASYDVTINRYRFIQEVPTVVE